MDRRTYLSALCSGGVAVLAGCISAGDDSENEDTDEPDTDNGSSGEGNGAAGSGSEDDSAEDETGGERDSSQTGEDDLAGDTPQDIIEAYVAASNTANEDAISEVMHSEAPINPENLEGIGFNFEPFDTIEPADVDVIEIQEAVEPSDILELELGPFWFNDADLDTVIGDEELVFVTVETGESEIDREHDTWVLVTDDERWTVFFISTDELDDRSLEDVREPAVIDEEETVVAHVEWDVEPYVDDFEVDDPLVEVQLTDSPDVDAETVRFETAVAGSNMELFDDSDGEVEVTWAGQRGAIGFDPEGDQIEVYAIEDGEKTLVHREHYEPEEDEDSAGY